MPDHPPSSSGGPRRSGPTIVLVVLAVILAGVAARLSAPESSGGSNGQGRDALFGRSPESYRAFTSHEDRVTALQRLLTAGGMDVGPMDGRFGPRTSAGLARFLGTYSVIGLGTEPVAGEEAIDDRVIAAIARVVQNIGPRLQGEGPGRYRGLAYDGQWLDGVPHGQGRMQWPDGAEYTGAFRNGLRHGVGRMRWPNGDRYEGRFADGDLNGQGTLTFASGRIAAGTWSANRLVGRDGSPRSVAPQPRAGTAVAPPASAAPASAPRPVASSLPSHAYTPGGDIESATECLEPQIERRGILGLTLGLRNRCSRRVAIVLCYCNEGGQGSGRGDGRNCASDTGAAYGYTCSDGQLIVGANEELDYTVGLSEVAYGYRYAACYVPDADPMTQLTSQCARWARQQQRHFEEVRTDPKFNPYPVGGRSIDIEAECRANRLEVTRELRMWTESFGNYAACMAQCLSRAPDSCSALVGFTSSCRNECQFVE